MGKLRDLGKKYGIPKELSYEEPLKTDEYNNVIPAESDNEPLSMDLKQTTQNNTSTVTSSNKKQMRMSWIRIDKIVLEKKNTLLDTLSVLYTALHDCAETISLVLKKEKGGLVQLYLGVRDMSAKQNYVSKYLLQRGLYGCLPGISYHDEQLNLDSDLTPFASYSTGIPSLKNDKKDGFIQGVERLINSTTNIPTFTIVFIAENVNGNDCINKKKELQARYSELSELAEHTTTRSDNNGTQISETVTRGSSSTSNESTSKGSNYSTTRNESISGTEGHSAAFFAGVNNSESKSEGISETKGTSENKTTSSSTTQNESNARTSGTNSSKGTSIQIKKENKEIKDELKRIEYQIERISNSSSIGMWNYSTYFLAESQTSSYILACIYRGLICGEKSEMSSFNIGTFDEENTPSAITAISNFTHPTLNEDANNAFTNTYSLVDSFELSIGMSLPLTSIPGVLVREQASFGRNIIISDASSDNIIPLGSISHFGNIENTNPVGLNSNLLTSHMFVTGTTGSGKSNAIYGILSNLLQRGVKSLVIEPAKGEYKNVFGGRDDFHVLGTNPKLMPLLKINPFSFPKGVHVEEHIDRLIDIFNACWPMYAAMPAVLKESICRAYESCGWDLVTSTSEYDIFPTFEDVENELNGYINESEYSADSKGDYKGALGTRLQSLSNGIVGKIFSGQELSSEELFGRNTIIDLSRIGSVETKSLIMGILIIKLNEYRMSENVGMNLPLRHVTVLEEAHNLLRATSTVQAQESSNLAGKSVEMIASSISEMRTYGEGFIIADQSPALLDKAAISNTNTKIIMNLLNQEDKLIAATSIGLTEQQTNELSRLKTGLAVIYQKGWEEAIQCQISHFEGFQPFIGSVHVLSTSAMNFFMMLLLQSYTTDNDLYRSDLVQLLNKIDLSGHKKIKILSLLSDGNTPTEELCAKIFVSLIGESIFIKASKLNDLLLFNNYISSKFKRFEGVNFENVDTFLDMYIKGCSLMNSTAFYENWLIQKTTSNK